MQIRIESHKNIPDQDLLLLKACNSSDTYSIIKPKFYELKTQILTKFASHDEYDLQIIAVKCWTCNGTGYYRHNTTHSALCNRCGGGIYKINRVALARFILNGELFHQPVARVHENGRGVDDNKYYLYRNTINGLIKHTPVPDLNPMYCYFVLLMKYDPIRYQLEFFKFVERLQTRAKHKMKKILALNPSSTLIALAKYLNINPETYA